MSKKNFEAKYIVLIVLVVITLLLTIFSLTIDDNRKLTPIEKVIKDTVIFTQKVIYKPFKYVGHKISQYNDMKNIYNEYKILKKELSKYNFIETENKALKDEIKSLKEELNIKKTLTEYEYLHATVVNRNIGYWYNTITVDKGSTSGIKKDMAVITSKGLIGKIEKVTSFSSDIKLISTPNPTDKISIIINSNDKTSYGLISNYDKENNLIIIEGLYSDNEILVDSAIYTSGLGDIFPRGILIGKVKEIVNDQYDLSKKILITPSNDFNDLKIVTILKRKDNNEN
ncbi:MAG: rod shape-determining protein MreC [Bacilli bacterium]